MGGAFNIDYSINEDMCYNHKVFDDSDIFYFTNIGSTHIEMHVALCGNINLEGWDRHVSGS